MNRICTILIWRALIWELVSKQVSQLEGLRHREMRIGGRTLRPKRECLQSTKRHSCKCTVYVILGEKTECSSTVFLVYMDGHKMGAKTGGQDPGRGLERLLRALLLPWIWPTHHLVQPHYRWAATNLYFWDRMIVILIGRNIVFGPHWLAERSAHIFIWLLTLMPCASCPQKVFFLLVNTVFFGLHFHGE